MFNQYPTPIAALAALLKAGLFVRMKEPLTLSRTVDHQCSVDPLRPSTFCWPDFRPPAMKRLIMLQPKHMGRS